jgi:UDP-glucose 4-epimerase
VVTGGAGFIGSHLVERLLSEGHKVIVIDDLSTGSLDNFKSFAKDPKLHVIESKVSACSELPKLMAEAKGIYHMAAAVGVELVIQSAVRTAETNLHETDVLLKAAAAHKVPLLFASTSEVYGKSEKPEFTETDDLLIGPPGFSRWAYACSKLMDEFMTLAYARERGLPAVVARLFNTVGPRQTGRYGMVLPRFIESAKRGKPLKVFGDGLQKRCFCYVADTVESLVRLLNCPLACGDVFNVGSSEPVTILGLAKTVVEILGSKSSIEFVSYGKAYGPVFEDMRYRKPAVEKLAVTIGYKPMTTLREIIQKTADTIP